MSSPRLIYATYIRADAQQIKQWLVNGSTFCFVLPTMKTRTLFALTVVNMSLLIWQVVQPRGTAAADIAPYSAVVNFNLLTNVAASVPKSRYCLRIRQ